MTHLTVQKVEKKQTKANLPEIKPGYTVRVHQKIKEGEKERVQIYEGLVIAMNHGYGASKTMTVRKVVEGIGVEKIFPLHSPNVAKIEVVRIGKVRRSKLYYMRNVSGKAARLKEIMVGGAQYAGTQENQSAEQTSEVSETGEARTETASASMEDTTENVAAPTPEVSTDAAAEQESQS